MRIGSPGSVKDFYASIVVEVFETLNEAFAVIAADPKLAMKVIEQVAYLRHHDDEDPVDVELRDDCRTGIAESVAFAMCKHRQKEGQKKATVNEAASEEHHHDRSARPCNAPLIVLDADGTTPRGRG